MKVIEKGELGYIRSRKRVDALWLLLFVVLGAVVFLAGYFITGVRANIFTVLSVLLVLPAAKRMVSLLVLMKKRGVTRERYEKMKKLAGAGTLYTEYVFTSTEKILHLDFLLIKNGNVLGVIAPSKQDRIYLDKYLSDCVKKVAPNYPVRLFENDEEMIRQLGRLTQAEPDEEKETALAGYLHSLAM